MNTFWASFFPLSHFAIRPASSSLWGESRTTPALAQLLARWSEEGVCVRV
jgi:hypothetical protein